MPRITLIGRDSSRMLMSPTYKVLEPQDGETVDRWRDRLGFTLHIQSMGNLCWYEDPEAQLRERRHSFVKKHTKEPVDHDEYVKVHDKPRYLLVFQHPAPYESHFEAVFADSYSELAVYRGHFMPFVNYSELTNVGRRLETVNERLDVMNDRLVEVSKTLRMIAANFTDLLAKEMNKEALRKKRRREHSHG